MVPFNRAADAFLETDINLVTEGFAGLGNIGQGMGDVALAFTKGRHLDGQYVETVKEVLPEFAYPEPDGLPYGMKLTVTPPSRMIGSDPPTRTQTWSELPTRSAIWRGRSAVTVNSR